MRGDHRGEKFSRKLLPKMIEEVFEGAAHRSVIIGRAEKKDIRARDPFLQWFVMSGTVGRVRVKERKVLSDRIENIDVATLARERVTDMLNDRARNGVLVQTSDNAQNLQLRIDHRH